MGLPVPPPPGRAKPKHDNMVEALADRAAKVAADRGKTGKPALTGTANAMTRGRGRKVGLHRKAGTTPPPPPGQAKRKKPKPAKPAKPVKSKDARPS